MKIISINVNKGGVGKTTVSNNFAEYLARNYRVLMIDFDDTADLTHRYLEAPKAESTVLRIFEGLSVEIIKLKENLSLIAGTSEVERLKEKLLTSRRREYLLGKWIAKNIDILSQDYDYLVIDTENDEGILTVNALLVSDMVLGIVEATKESTQALARLKKFVPDLNDDFEMTLPLYYIANEINLSKKACHELLTSLAGQENYLGYLPSRTSLANWTSIYTQKKGEFRDQKQTLEETTKLFDKIKKQLDEEAAKDE